MMNLGANMKRNLSRLTAISFGCVLSTLSACSTMQHAQKMEQVGSDLAQQNYAITQRTARPSESFVVDSGFYAEHTPILKTDVLPAKKLPSSFFKDASLNQHQATSLTEIASLVTKISGYPVTIDQDVLGGSGGAPAAAGGAAGGAVVGSGPILSEVLFNGNLAGLLDALTGQLNLSWRWNGDQIQIYRYETKMFRLNAIPGDMTTSANLNTTSSGTGGGGTSGQTTSMSTSMQIWGDVEKAIKAVMSSGGKLSMTPSAGVIVVRDTPDVMRQVEQQIGQLDKIYQRQVQLNVEVYSIERNENQAASLDWSLFWQQASQKYGFGYTSGGSAAANPAAPNVGITIKHGPFTGSGLMISALNKLGRAVLLTSAAPYTLNGQTVPINVSREQAYLQSFSTTVNTAGGSNQSTTTLTPGLLTEGFSMNFTPRILDDNNVLIRFAVDLSTIEDIVTFTSPDGKSAVQLPKRSVRNFLQNVNVKSGDTLILTGFQQAGSNQSSSAPVGKAWFLGGSKSAVVQNRTIVIAVTPYVTK
jgi:type IVB pilus formation R64 PilN family outer membrane protein